MAVFSRRTPRNARLREGSGHALTVDSNAVMAAALMFTGVHLDLIVCRTRVV